MGSHLAAAHDSLALAGASLERFVQAVLDGDGLALGGCVGLQLIHQRLMGGGTDLFDPLAMITFSTTRSVSRAVSTVSRLGVPAISARSMRSGPAGMGRPASQTVISSVWPICATSALKGALSSLPRFIQHLGGLGPHMDIELGNRLRNRLRH